MAFGEESFGVGKTMHSHVVRGYSPCVCIPKSEFPYQAAFIPVLICLNPDKESDAQGPKCAEGEVIARGFWSTPARSGGDSKPPNMILMPRVLTSPRTITQERHT